MSFTRLQRRATAAQAKRESHLFFIRPTAVNPNFNMYPDVQRRAQAEIDRVVLKGTLPGFQDRDSLPYVDCLLKELQRWRPAIPLGVQRCAMKGDYYGGYYIPEGAIVSPNVWAITRDEANYKDPERFWPERFENPETAELDPYKYAFGFGRRTCAGLHFADASIYIAVVSILATFDIGKPKDENGNEVELNVPHTSGFISRPERFECSIKPRSDAMATLIKDAAREHGW